MGALVPLQLFTTAGCHLCGQLEAMLVQSGAQVVLEKVEIADDAARVARYATRIPVLRTSAGEEYSLADTSQTLSEWLTMQGVELSVPGLALAPPQDALVSKTAVMRNGRRFLN